MSVVRNSTVVNQAQNMALNRIVLYKRGHFIENANSFSIVEISSTRDGALYIAIFDIQSDASLLMHQKPDQARRTLIQFDNDF